MVRRTAPGYPGAQHGQDHVQDGAIVDARALSVRPDRRLEVNPFVVARIES
jgi:hypothetical protein